MNRILPAAAALAATTLMLGAPLVAAQPDPRPPEPLTRARVQADVQTRFAAVDADRDGAVTKAELDAFRATAEAAHTAAREARRAEHFARLDTNKDGQISKAEFAAPPERGADMPMRHGRDGMGGPGGKGPRGGMRDGGPRGDMAGMGMHGGLGGWGGLLGPKGDQRAADMFTLLDANHDGRVTLAEASARPLAMFDKADTNKDGTITPEEHRAAHHGMGGKWRGRRG